MGPDPNTVKSTISQLLGSKAISFEMGKDPSSSKQRKIVVVADDAEDRLAALAPVSKGAGEQLDEGSF